MRRLQLLFAALLLLCSRLPAGEVYFGLRLSELKVLEGEIPARWKALPEGFDRRMRPYAALDQPGEAYFDLSVWPYEWTRQLPRVRLAIRVEKAEDITGRLYLPEEDWSGFKTVRFHVPASKADPKARTAFLRAKERYLRHVLWQRDVPGASLFRLQLREVLKAQGKKKTAEWGPSTPVPRPFREVGVEDTYDLFTGGRALSENLQLDRLVRPTGEDAQSVPIDTLPGIQIPAFDWEALIRDAKPEPDPLARYIPADQPVVLFPTFKAFTVFQDELSRSPAPFLYLFEIRAEDSLIKERYQEQLCMELSALSRLLGPAVIAGVAVTASDPYLPTGTNIAVLFHAKRPKLLLAYLYARQQTALLRGAKHLSGKIGATEYRGLATRDRSICSYVAQIGDAVVVTNSLLQLKRISEVSRSPEKSLAKAPEYVFSARFTSAANRRKPLCSCLQTPRSGGFVRRGSE